MRYERQPMAVFRADASVAIGTGHVRRCFMLARSLEHAGYVCGFAVSPGSLETAGVRLPESMELVVLDGVSNEIDQLVDHWRKGVDLIVVDHYGFDARFESACRLWARCVLTIDDLADRAHDCDVLLDQTPGRDGSHYTGRVGESTHMLLGADYALLDSRFAALRSRALARRRSSDRLHRLLVSLGATDPDDVTSRALKAIGRVSPEIAVDVVLGQASPHLEAVRRQVTCMRQPVNLHVSTDDMPTLMMEADFAIGASGTTALERCCLGLPTLAVTTASNQEWMAERLHERGALVLLGRQDDVTAAHIEEAMTQLVGRPDALRDMAAASAMVCDGRGTDRVVGAIEDILARDQG